MFRTKKQIKNRVALFLWVLFWCLPLSFLVSSGAASGESFSYKKFHGSKMLIITVPKFQDGLKDYLRWKRNRGLDVEVDIAAVSRGVEGIRSAVRKKYQTSGLTFVVLIGDIEDVPSPYFMGAPSDPSYVLLEGDDCIGDALISRISVKTADELSNQLNRIILYEKQEFRSREWLDNAIVVGTQEFNGIAHTTGIVNAMRNHPRYFDKVIQILETDTDTRQTLIDAIETYGASMIVYNSHGSVSGFHNIVFTTEEIPLLKTFGGSFPFIHGAGCSTGSFQWEGGDCFAEALLKVGTVRNPFGPIAVLAFSRSANPGPAMMAQREAFKNLYYNDDIRTIGELCYYSNLHAMKNFIDYEAEKFYKHWHLFGDCSTPLPKGKRPESRH